MKKIFFALLIVPVLLHAQDKVVIPDSLRIWKHGGKFNLDFTQASFTNWAAGGINSISGTMRFSTFVNYKKGYTSWENSLDLGYGVMQQSTSAFVKKTDDKIDFTSKYGRYAFGDDYYYSALLGFKTQFQPGYNYMDDTAKTKISDFMSPGYMLLALGLEYKPNTRFSFILSPLTGRITFVQDPDLANAGAYGVTPATYDTAGHVLTPGNHTYKEFGSYIRMQYKAEIMKNVNLATRLELFSNYLHNPQNIDINADFLLNMEVNKFISCNIGLSAIYDDDTNIAVSSHHDGVIDGMGPRLQFRQIIGVGFEAEF